jgi:hypothetical protein
MILRRLTSYAPGWRVARLAWPCRHRLRSYDQIFVIHTSSAIVHFYCPIFPLTDQCFGTTRSAYRRTHFLHRRRSRSLSLSQVWRTNEGHRTADRCRNDRCRNPTSFSTTDQLCGMKRRSPTPTLRLPAEQISSFNIFNHAFQVPLSP